MSIPAACGGWGATAAAYRMFDSPLDFNGQTIQGLGPLSDAAQRGMYLHPTDAVSMDREPLDLFGP